MTPHPQQLPLLPPAARALPAAIDHLHLLLLNSQHASPTRARRQVSWLASQNADVVVVTEVGSGPGGDALLDALAEHGYHSLITRQPSPPNDYRAVLASRGPTLESLPSPVSMLPHRAPIARIHLTSAPLTLLGLYVPSRGPRERRNQDKRAFQAAVTTTLPDLITTANSPVIVAGDLNVLEPGHLPHYRVFGTWEYDFYRSFTNAGLTDAFRHLHPHAAEHSWFGRGGNGYRFDHIFTTTAHKEGLRACRYLHQPRTLGLSDHAAMYLHWHIKRMSHVESRASIL
ncbi:endonuclease/exonuclease/phosphatase family protein [Actinomadura viridis]|uniref:endonuclease/exonuclease/phosphatase family protein n=1 Tax=Actinomadura viridis TaxID=58110 RepID=UPI0036C921DD